MEHIIVMVKKENPAEQVILNGVMYCDYLYGCLVALTTADGARPLFETDVWDMYDLTPRKGWQDDNDPIPEGVARLLAPVARKGCLPVDILNVNGMMTDCRAFSDPETGELHFTFNPTAKGALVCKAFSDPETGELHFTFTPETKSSGIPGPADGCVAVRNGAVTPVIKKDDGKWYLSAPLPDPKALWQCAVTLVRRRACEHEEWVDTLYLTLPGDQRPDTTKVTMEAFVEQKVRELLSAWLQTSEGVSATVETTWDFNWGDTVMNLPIEFGGARLSWKENEDIPITASIALSVNQDELLAPDRVHVDIIGSNGAPIGKQGYVDFQMGNLILLDEDGNEDDTKLESLDGLMVSAPYGVFGIAPSADGGYEIRVQ